MSLKLEIHTGINPKEFFPDSKHLIEYTFTIGERHYFQYSDVLNTPYERALQCLVYYKEIDMNVDREFLKLHTAAFDNALKQPSINIDTLIELKQLNDQLKQRLELPKHNELMYKLASVVFFDQFEKAEVYEFGYGQKKINYWKKNVSVEVFFLSQPLITLIPYLATAGENIEAFSAMTEKATKEHLDRVLAMLSPGQKTALKSK